MIQNHATVILTIFSSLPYGIFRFCFQIFALLHGKRNYLSHFERKHETIPEMQAEHFSPLQAAHAWGQARQVLTAWAGRERSGHTSTHVEMCSRWSG